MTAKLQMIISIAISSMQICFEIFSFKSCLIITKNTIIPGPVKLTQQISLNEPDEVMWWSPNKWKNNIYQLIHWGWVTHIGVGRLGHHWFRKWIGACLAPGLYLNQCWVIVNWTFWIKSSVKLSRNLYIFIQEKAFENAVSKLAAMMSRPQCVNHIF